MTGGRFARDRFTDEASTRPVIAPAAADPVIAHLRREAELSTLERLIEEYPGEALEIFANRRQQKPPRAQRQP